jgi:hypothetical protein
MTYSMIKFTMTRDTEAAVINSEKKNK